MNASSTATSPVLRSPVPRRRRGRHIGGADLGRERSGMARRLAAAILEVLAGERTPSAAALALGISVPRYYQVETKALQGLLQACEPKPGGRQAQAKSETGAAIAEAVKLRKENVRLQREVGRQQALVRAAQRSIGLPPPQAPSAKAGKSAKKTRKRRVVRALSFARRLQQDAAPSASAATASTPTGFGSSEGDVRKNESQPLAEDF
jgi:hypothetical protein